MHCLLIDLLKSDPISNLKVLTWRDVLWLGQLVEVINRPINTLICGQINNVQKKFNYCNALLLGIPAYKIQRLQRMHNIAARMVAHSDRDHDIDEVLEYLHCLPVKYRNLYKVLMLVYKMNI